MFCTCQEQFLPLSLSVRDDPQTLRGPLQLPRQPQQDRRPPGPNKPAHHDESRSDRFLSRRHNFIVYSPPRPSVKSKTNDDRKSSGKPNQHRYTVQTMNTRRSFIKTSAGISLAFGSGVRLASAVENSPNGCTLTMSNSGLACIIDCGPSGPGKSGGKTCSYTCGATSGIMGNGGATTVNGTTCSFT